MNSKNQKSELEILAEKLEYYKNIEETLKEVEQIAHIGHWEWDYISQTLTWSDEIFSIFGVEREFYKVSVENFEKTVHPDDLESVVMQRNKALELLDTFEISHRIIKPSGEIRFVLERGKVIRENNFPKRLIGTVQDITEQKHEKEIVQETLQFHIDLLDTISCGIIIYDKKSLKIEHINFFASLLVCIRKEELLGEPITKIMHAQSHEDLLHKETSGAYYFEADLLTQSSYELPIYASVHTIQIKGEEKFIVSFFDMSVLKIAQKALKESEERWKFAVEGAGDGLWDWNIQSNKVFFSHKWKGMLGFEDNEVSNGLEEWSKRVHPDDIEQCYTDIQAHMDGKTEFYVNIHRVICKDGSFKWILDRGKITSFSKEGKPIRMIGTHHDITESVEMQKELVQSNIDKDRFISILAHDLKNPFHVILGFSNLFSTSIEDFEPAKLKEIAKSMYSITHDTYLLLEDLLLWSRARSGRLDLNLAPINFKIICLEIFSNIKSYSSVKEIDFQCVENDNIQYIVDTSMFKTILRNLVSNAVKYTNTGGTITVTSKQDNKDILFSVCDTGVGIPEEKLVNIWNYSGTQSTLGTKNEKGTGFGLTVCKDFVEKHGGKIWVESKVEKGTCFYFTIPIHT